MPSSSFSKPIKRSAFLDVYRGLAVFLMVVFHLCWDLKAFGFLDYSIRDPFWVYFRSLILTLFLTAVGWSSYLTLMQKSDHAFWKRNSKLFLAAACISIATFFATPDQWIFFGILHFIFIASLISQPLVKWPVFSAALGILIVMIYHFTDWLYFPNALPWITEQLMLPSKTLDIVFPFPWIGVVLIGPILGYLGWHRLPTPNNVILTLLAFMGRHALLIYLLHQVVLFSLVAGFKVLVDLVS